MRSALFLVSWTTRPAALAHPQLDHGDFAKRPPSLACAWEPVYEVDMRFQRVEQKWVVEVSTPEWATSLDLGQSIHGTGRSSALEQGYFPMTRSG